MRLAVATLFGMVLIATGFIPTTADAQVRGAVPRPAVAVDGPATLRPGESGTLVLTFDVPSGLHAQSSRPLNEFLIGFAVIPAEASGVTWGRIDYPPGERTIYPLLGEMDVYTGTVTVTLPLTVGLETSGGVTLEGGVRYQLCDDSTCFPPDEAAWSHTLRVEGTPVTASPMASAMSASSTSATATRAEPPTAGRPVEVAAFGRTLVLDSLWVVLGVAFVAGLVFNVMPCVLPVLPLKAMGFYEASHHDRARTVAFGLAFSAGLVGVFALLGMGVLTSRLMLGRTFVWGEQFAYPAFVWGVVIVLGGLGAAMLAGWSFTLPRSLYGLNFRHDTLGGNAMWGALTAVLSTPCTAPLFPPVLGWAVGQPVLVGFLAVVTVGIGMASPYLLLSAFPEAARRFPRVGPAAELVKQMMGFLLLASAAFFVGVATLGDPGQWWLVFGVTVWAGLYLVARAVQMTRPHGVGTGLLAATAVAVLAGGATLTVAVRATGFGGAYATAGDAQVSGTSIWADYDPQTLADARASGSMVLVKLTADWCLNCKYIEQTVYRDADALAALREAGVVLLKADLTRRGTPGWTLLNDLGGIGIPLTAIYRPGDDEPTRLDSIYTAYTLLRAIGRGPAVATTAASPPG